MIFCTKEGEIKPFPPPVRAKEVWICMEISCGEVVLRKKVSLSEMRVVRMFKLCRGVGGGHLDTAKAMKREKSY